LAGAPSPSICTIGSPGTRWISTKTTETTSQSTGSVYNTRVMRGRNTGALTMRRIRTQKQNRTAKHQKKKNYHREHRVSQRNAEEEDVVEGSQTLSLWVMRRRVVPAP